MYYGILTFDVSLDILYISLLHGDNCMQTTVVKWGNSHGIRLPKAFLQNIQISENDPVDVILENERIVIKKIDDTRHKTIKQRLKDFYGENYEQHTSPQTEVDWGKPEGNEVW